MTRPFNIACYQRPTATAPTTHIPAATAPTTHIPAAVAPSGTLAAVTPNEIELYIPVVDNPLGDGGTIIYSENVLP
jgi:hypothetical protein